MSRDLDFFHDTDSAVAASWDGDRQLLEREGFTVRVLRERDPFARLSFRSSMKIQVSVSPELPCVAPELVDGRRSRRT